MAGKATKINTITESISLFFIMPFLRRVQKISFQTITAKIIYPKGNPRMISSFKNIEDS